MIDLRSRPRRVHPILSPKSTEEMYETTIIKDSRILRTKQKGIRRTKVTDFENIRREPILDDVKEVVETD